MSKLISDPKKFCIFHQPNHSDLSICLNEKNLIEECINYSSFVTTKISTFIGNRAKINVFEIIETFQEKVILSVEKFAEKLFFQMNIEKNIENLKFVKVQLETFNNSNVPDVDEFVKAYTKLSDFLRNDERK